MKIPLQLSIALILCALALPALAKSKKAKVKKEETPKGFTFQVVTPGKAAPDGLKFRQEEKSDFIPLAFHPSNLSKTYRYEGASPLEFFAEAPMPGGEVLVTARVASFTPTAEGGAYILIFVAGGEAGKWDIRAVPVSDRTMPPTAIAFYNGLDAAIEALVADDPVSVAPGLSSPRSVAGLTGKPGVTEVTAFDASTGEMVTEKVKTLNEGVRVVLRPAGEGEEEARPFFDSSITISPSASYLMLIFPPEDAAGRRYRVKALSIVPQPPEASRR